MKLSDDARKYAEALMSKRHHEIALWAEEDQRRVRGLRTQSNPQFGLMISHHEESIRRSFKGMINSYVEAYKMDGALIDDEDNTELIEMIRSMINSRLHHVTHSVTSRDFLNPYTGEKVPNLDSEIGGRFDRLLGEAAIELNLARNQLVMEYKTKEESQSNAGNQINIYGPNLGPIQQGGRGNVQIVNIDAEFETKIQEAFDLVENSTLAPVQKLKAINDIRTVHELSRLEKSPEVREEARTRLDDLTSIISLSADLVSLGIPVVQIIRGCFGV